MFCSTDDLANYMGRTFSPAQQMQAQAALEHSTAIIQSYCRQNIEYVHDDAAQLVGTWTNLLELPERPVIDLTSITMTIGGVTSMVTDYEWDGRYSLYRQNQGFWGGPTASLAVVYSHGWETIPAAVQAVCLSLAARRWQNPTGTNTNESAGDVSVTYGGGPATLTLLPHECRILSRAGFRRWDV